MTTIYYLRSVHNEILREEENQRLLTQGLLVLFRAEAPVLEQAHVFGIDEDRAWSEAGLVASGDEIPLRVLPGGFLLGEKHCMLVVNDEGEAVCPDMEDAAFTIGAALLTLAYTQPTSDGPGTTVTSLESRDLWDGAVEDL